MASAASSARRFSSSSTSSSNAPACEPSRFPRSFQLTPYGPWLRPGPYEGGRRAIRRTLVAGDPDRNRAGGRQMETLLDGPAIDLATAIRRRDVSSVEVVTAFLT